MAKIKQIKSAEILDSRGSPTIETTVILTDGAVGIASCPSGTSIGSYEAVELRDHDPNRFQGLGVLKAIDNVQNLIVPKLIGMEASKQQEIDKVLIELDGTQNKGRLGANATLSVSMAVSKAAAKSAVLPLFLYLRQFIKNSAVARLKIPTPLFNLINGGKHADNNIDFQEFLVIPATSKPYSEALQAGITIYSLLKTTLRSNNLSTLVGEEGGFGPRLSSNQDAFSLLEKAINASSYKLGFDIFLGLDAAANSFYRNGQYYIKDKAMPYSCQELISYFEELKKQFGLLYLEDPLFEDDWEGWAKICLNFQNTLIVGDDLTATNPYRLQMAIDKKAISGIIIKPNQIGTVIEALAVVEVARVSGLKIIVSHRSGETNDDFIADFAVAVSADYVKFGAPARGERVAKYNRLLLIEKQLKAL